jgi:hypothetical protein
VGMLVDWPDRVSKAIGHRGHRAHKRERRAHGPYGPYGLWHRDTESSGTPETSSMSIFFLVGVRQSLLRGASGPTCRSPDPTRVFFLEHSDAVEHILGAATMVNKTT